MVGGANGQLGDPKSGTTDPTFWLLHAFTDLQWARWEAGKGTLYDDLGQVGGLAADQFADWRVDKPMAADLTDLNKITNMYKEKDGRPVTDTGVRPNDVLNYWIMPDGGYTYDYRPKADKEDRELLGAPVPEPASIALVTLAFVGLAGMARRRK